MMRERSAITEPTAWYATLPVPALERATGGDLGVVVRSYDGSGALMEKPALCENLVCLHQGGTKRVHRWQEGRHERWDVPPDSISLMPMFHANRWFTEGPIAFTHLTLSPGLLARFAREEFDRDPRDLTVTDRVGSTDPLIANLLLELVDALRRSEGGRLYRDSLVTSIVVRVLRRHSSMPPAGTKTPACGGLAGWQLRRVFDYLTARLDHDVGVDDLVRLTGLSRAHFFRAFRQSTGQTPSRYLLALRVEHSRRLLAKTPDTICTIARSVGFSGSEPFARAFQRSTGLTPKEWRRRHRTTTLCFPSSGESR